MQRLFDSPVQLIILLVVILLIFGAPKLPLIAKNIGKSLKVFKSEVKDLRKDEEAPEPDPAGEPKSLEQGESRPAPVSDTAAAPAREVAPTPQNTPRDS